MRFLFDLIHTVDKATGNLLFVDEDGEDVNVFVHDWNIVGSSKESKMLFMNKVRRIS